MRLSRGCYDKYHRCPGWAGGGLKWAQKIHCAGGYITVSGNQSSSKFRFGHCDKCDVIVLPRITRYVDPTWWIYELKYRYRIFRDEKK